MSSMGVGGQREVGISYVAPLFVCLIAAGFPPENREVPFESKSKPLNVFSLVC